MHDTAAQAGCHGAMCVTQTLSGAEKGGGMTGFRYAIGV